MPLLQDAFDAIDQANSADPTTTIHDGQPVPAALLYSQRMTQWLHRLCPEAPEPLRLAARAQHIRRWTLPRSDYPADRIGYLKWRTRLYHFHAEEAGRILAQVGYDEPTISRVQRLLRKEGIKSDPEMQTLEDVICLVFLENYFADFAQDHDTDKLIGIIRKTWKKMSPTGQSFALQLPLPPPARHLIERALSPESPQT